MERADGSGAILGTAAAALQLVAVRGRRELGCEIVAAFSPGDDSGVAGDHDGAGAAGERLLLRSVPCGDFDTERDFEHGMEPATVGGLGRGDAVRDIV